MHRATKPSLEKGDGRTGGIWLNATTGGRLVEVGRNLPIEYKSRAEMRGGIASTGRGTSTKFMVGTESPTNAKSPFS